MKLHAITVAMAALLLISGGAMADTLAEDDFNRADGTDLGSKWHEEANNYEIKDNRMYFALESNNAVINQNVSLAQGNYTVEFTYIDLNATTTTARLMIHFNMQSYTSRTNSMVIQFRESNNYALAYWGNGTYIDATSNIGLAMSNNTQYKFSIVGDNVSIYQNGTHLGNMEYWGDQWSNGTVGFGSDTLDAVTSLDNFKVSNATSSGSAGAAPDPTSLDFTRDTTWINHTWSAGAGNVTDSYNVRVNGVWHNGSSNTYYNNTGMAAHAWSNMSVYAWNTSYSSLSSGSVSHNLQVRSTLIAEDDFNRADNSTLGPNWYEEANNYEIKDNRMYFRNESSAAVLNQNVSLAQGNYTVEFTYIDLNATATTARLMLHFYTQSYTSRTNSMVIQLRENNNYALAYWGNGTYIADTGNIGISMQNNTRYKFDVAGDNVSIYQNETKIGFLESWGNRWSNGTIGFSSDVLGAVTSIDDVEVWASAPGPVITAHTPTATVWPEVTGSQTFTLHASKSLGCKWYINGTLKETDAESNTHAYTNASLQRGTWNVTAVVADLFGQDSQTWVFEVGADSITYIVMQDTPTNKLLIAKWNVTGVGSRVTAWSYNQSVSVAGWTYSMRFENGTHIVNHTAAYTDETLIFNGSSLLPAGIYYIDAKTPDLTAPANQYYMYNNWSTDHTFAQIAAKESNAVVYSWYNHNTGVHESYYVGRAYNADKIVSMNCSVSCFFEAETIIQVTPRT